MFKTIKRYPDYEINENGDIRRKDSDILRKPYPIRGHKKIILTRNGKTEYVSRLVAETYISEPKNNSVVMHIDGDLNNNHVSNLEWTDKSYIQKRSYGLGINAPGGYQKAKRIMIVETGDIFPSIRACARAIGGSPSGIRQCLNGYISKHKGYSFRLI